MKKISKHIIIKLCKFLGIYKLFYFLNRNRKKIIGYHNIIPDEYFDNSINLDYSIKNSEFKKHLDIINKRFKVGLNLYNTQEITLTFDDGYQNQYSQGSKILDEYNNKGYFFYAANLLNDIDTLLIDKIIFWVDYVKEGYYSNEKYNIEFSINDKKSRRLAWEKINNLIQDNIKFDKIYKLLDEMYKFEDIKIYDEFYTMRFTSIKKCELEYMKKNGHKIGAHSSSHEILSKLSKEELENDIEKCKRLLDQGIYNTNTFCYPFGSEYEVNKETIKKIKEKGFKNAISFVNHPNLNIEYDNFFMPRITLPRTMDEDYIDFVLSGTLYFIKNKKLFPKFKTLLNTELVYE